MFSCSFPLDGKDKAVDVGAIPELVSLLGDDNTDVRAQAAGAIMTYVAIAYYALCSNEWFISNKFCWFSVYHNIWKHVTAPAYSLIPDYKLYMP